MVTHLPRQSEGEAFEAQQSLVECDCQKQGTVRTKRSWLNVSMPKCTFWLRSLTESDLSKLCSETRFCSLHSIRVNGWHAFNPKKNKQTIHSNSTASPTNSIKTPLHPSHHHSCTSLLSPPQSSDPQAITLPSALRAAKAFPLPVISTTSKSSPATGWESPPKRWSPHVTTLPSCLIAAKAKAEDLSWFRSAMLS